MHTHLADYVGSVSDWTFVPSSTKTPDIGAYYIARLTATGATRMERAEIIISLEDAMRASNDGTLNDLISCKLQVAIAELKAKLDKE